MATLTRRVCADCDAPVGAKAHRCRSCNARVRREERAMNQSRNRGFLVLQAIALLESGRSVPQVCADLQESPQRIARSLQGAGLLERSGRFLTYRNQLQRRRADWAQENADITVREWLVKGLTNGETA